MKEDDKTLSPLVRILKYKILPRLTQVSSICILFSLVGLIVFDTFERKTVVEEHGFAAAQSNKFFNQKWTLLAHKIMDVLQNSTNTGTELTNGLEESSAKNMSVNIQQIEMRKANYQRACLEAKKMFRSIQNQRKRLWIARDGHCTPDSEEEAHYVSHVLKRHIGTGEGRQQAKHPLLVSLDKLLKEPFLANVPDQWLGPRFGMGPTKTETSSYKNMKTRRYALEEVVIYNSSSSVGHDIAVRIKSSRGDTRDVFVLMFLFDWDNSKDYGVGALGVIMSRFLSTVPWMSRDVILVFSDNKAPYASSSRDFLDAYLFDPTSEFNDRGIIRMAAIVEAGYEKLHEKDVFVDVEGYDGLLPNQDLPNVYLSEAKSIEMTTEVRQGWDSLSRLASNNAVHRPHTPFLVEAIPAFTAIVGAKKLLRRHMLESIAKSLEGLVRSQSNVLQSLHHSFNFYLYTNLGAHVSSGVYLFVLMPLAAIPALWGMADPVFWKASCYAPVTVMFSVLFQVPAYLLATAQIGSFTLRPSCVGVDLQELNQYAFSVAIWFVVSISGGCFTVLFIFFFNQKQREQNAIEFSTALKAVIRIWGSVFLVIVMVLNWSLSVPLTLTLVPGLLCLTPLNIRAIAKGVVAETRKPKKIIRVIRRLLMPILLILWLCLSLFLLSPFNGSMQTGQKKIIRSVAINLSSNVENFLLHPIHSILSPFDLRRHAPYRFVQFLKTGRPFLLNKESSIGHPLMNLPAVQINSERISRLPKPINGFVVFVANHLSSNFVLHVYLSARDAVCVGSPYLAQIVLGVLPIYILIILFVFFLRVEGDKIKLKMK